MSSNLQQGLVEQGMDAERIKVLYVDDEEGNLMAFRASFRRDFDVRVASSAKDGLAMLDEQPVHVVISDQRMPVMSGAEFLAQVRERHPKSIRIMLTGFSDIEAVIDAVNKGGIHAYITKPWDPIDLKLRIEQAYEVHALRAERERLFQRYRQVFDTAGDPIVIVDEVGNLQDVNPAAERIMGLERAELLRSGIHPFVPDPATLLEAMKAHRDGKSFTNVDITLRTPQGAMLDCLMTATYQGRTPDGKALFQAIIKDITDRKQEEVRLKKLNHDLDRRVAARTKQLMEALDDLGAFSYSVAHDLRSPLKGMRSLTDHLSELAVMRSDAEISEVSERIHRSTSRLIALVDDLLRFARTDTQEVDRTAVDLREAVLECLNTLDVSGRRLEITMPEAGHALVPADKAMLHVVLTNVLSNALKFTRTRDQARITVAHAVQDGDHIVSITDNGIGFNAERSEQLFGVFKRLHKNDEFEGTGIGLAIVQRIVQKHGGTCWAEGREGEGATVHLRFPAVAGELSFRMAG
jgi:PAS domain S-box-containing protein